MTLQTDLTQQKKRGLIVDILFPNKFSKWRNVEIKSFIENYDVDILVYKIDSYANVKFDFDWDFINSDNTLKDYNIFILDPKYNYINKWNKNLDGTKFNLSNKGSYIITKKNFFDINSYDFIYHVFLMCYENFNRNYNFDLKKQFIHLYPGGGFFGNPSKISKFTNIISTNPITSNNLESMGYKNYKDIWNGPLMFKNENFTEKNYKDNSNFTVCFSSMGINKEKGGDVYKKLVNDYFRENPTDNVNFISIGNCDSDPLIKNYNPMDYKSLDSFYEKNVNIYINLTNKTSFNGWPIGLEALIKGSALITTDPNNIKQYYTDLKGDEFFIVENYKECVPLIKKLYENVNFLNESIKKGQDFFKNYINFNNNQKKIFDFINSKL